MPKQNLPGPRFELHPKAANFLASRDARYQRGRSAEPNIRQIALTGQSATPSTLRRIINGDLPVSLEAIAGMVKAAAPTTDDEVWEVMRNLLVWVPDGAQDADRHELAAAA